MNQNNDLVAVPEWNDEFWDKMASVFSQTSPAEVKSLYEEAIRDVDLLPTGETESLVNGDDLVPSGLNPSSSQRNDTSSMRKGVSWSEEEEGLFMEGLKKFGKGRWKDISKHFVKTRTPTQVASHAQKFFLRLFPADNKRPKSDMPRRHRQSSKVAPSHPPIPATVKIPPQERGCEAPVFAPDQFNGEQNVPSFSSMPPCQFDPQVDYGALAPDPSHPLQHQSNQTEQQADQNDPPSNPVGYFHKEQDSSILIAPIPAPSHQEAPLPSMDPTPGQPRQQDPCPSMDFDHIKTDEDIEHDYLDFVSLLPDLCVI